MKINIFLPFIGKTGGILVALEHARFLAKRGHDVAVYYPLLPYGEYWYGRPFLERRIHGQLRQFLGNLRRFHRRVPWFHAPLAVRPVPWIGNATIRDADVAMATSFPTAYSVNALRPSKGRKFYFIQGYEQWGVDTALVDRSFSLPLSIITIAPHLTALLKEKFGRDACAEVHNGIDLAVFHPPARKNGDIIRIAMMYHENPVKGTPDGLRALEEVHRRFPSARIALFGERDMPGRPEYIEFTRDPSPAELVRLYQESRIFLSPSLLEGWHLPPMEAMACGCAVVATRVGCIPTLYDGSNMLVAEPGRWRDLADKLVSLLENPGECRRIAERGHETILRYTWEAASERLEKAFQP